MAGGHGTHMVQELFGHFTFDLKQNARSIETARASIRRVDDWQMTELKGRTRLLAELTVDFVQPGQSIYLI